MIRQLVLVLLLPAFLSIPATNAFEEIYHWRTIDIAFPSESDRRSMLEYMDYIPVNNIISNLRVWKDRIYVTLPRWKPGVPVTLGSLPREPTFSGNKAQIEAYPSFDMQTIGNCDCFQFVQGLEIDTFGRLWVLDSGRTETLTVDSTPQCPPRLTIIDLETSNTLRTYEFPEEVTPRNHSLLTGIVLDSTDGGFAYIMDVNQVDPGIIVYSLSENRSWKMRHPNMRRNYSSSTLHSDSTRLPIASIALSPLSASVRSVYYTLLAPVEVFKVPTSILKDENSNIDQYVRSVVQKASRSEGMIMEADGMIYLGNVDEHAIARWNTSAEDDSWFNQDPLMQKDPRLTWPSNLAIDEKGYLWVISNSFQNFAKGSISSTQYNYIILKQKLTHKNYQYREDGSEPEFMEITAGASAVVGSFVLALIGLGAMMI